MSFKLKVAGVFGRSIDRSPSLTEEMDDLEQTRCTAAHGVAKGAQPGHAFLPGIRTFFDSRDINKGSRQNLREKHLGVYPPKNVCFFFFNWGFSLGFKSGGFIENLKDSKRPLDVNKGKKQ